MADLLVIGSRGSKLALTQSHLVRELLTREHPDLEVEVRVIQTTGDAEPGSLRRLGGQGLFTREIERALLDGRIDLAVHSLKDLPTDSPDELMLVATPPREDVRDALLLAAEPAGTSAPGGLEALPQGARLGTGSLRRQAQLLALRPDLRFDEIRGNLDTRIGKLKRGDCDGLVLAAAGLHRLGWEHHIHAYLAPSAVLPAVGQAALGLQMRRGHALAACVATADHAPTHAAVRAERSFLAHLGGGCQAPIAAWAQTEGDALRLEGLVGRPDGTCLLRGRASDAPERAEDLGGEVAEQLRRQGANALLAEADNTA